MKRQTIQIIIAAITIFNSPAFADSGRILVRAPNVDNTDYKAYLLTDSDSLSITNRMRKDPVARPALKSLRDEFANAQFKYLQADETASRSEWLNLTSFAYKADWPNEYRQMIDIGFMRLAQISTDSAGTVKWLKLCAEYDPTYKPDRTLFPPPLVEQFENLRAKEMMIQIPTRRFSSFGWILINGRAQKIVPGRTFQVPDQTVRVTFLSSVYQPVTRVLPSRSLVKFSPREVPWVSGHCKSPIWNSAINMDYNLGALFQNSCVAMRGRKAPIYPLTSQNAAEQSNQPPPAYWAMPTSDTAITAKAEKPFYKKGWFWVGVAAIAGAVIYAQRSHQSDSADSTTHTSGF